MKLGEALTLRADLQKRLNRVQALLLENATTQEGDTPAVAPVGLLEEYRRLATEHNRTNVGARVGGGGEELTLADAVVRRDRLAKEAGLLRDLAGQAMPRRSRYLHTEVKHVPAVDVADLLAQADRLSREHRELDTRVQQTNWEVDLQ